MWNRFWPHLDDSLIVSARQYPFRDVVQRVDGPIVGPLVPPGDLHIQHDALNVDRRIWGIGEAHVGATRSDTSGR